jgi:hypothetical protein
MQVVIHDKSIMQPYLYRYKKYAKLTAHMKECNLATCNAIFVKKKYKIKQKATMQKNTL